MIRVSLIGIGKTGKEIAKMLFEEKDMEIVSAMCSPNSLKKHIDLDEIVGIRDSGIKIEGTDKLEEVILRSKPDIIVDFSTPKSTLTNAEIISKMKVNMVIGTTGFSDIDIKRIETLAHNNNVGIIYSPNITPGVNVLMVLTKIASVLLDNYDFQISEIHHKNKKDIPSGTAVKIVDEITSGLLYSGKGMPEAGIPINSVRAGGVVGKHEVLIAGENDRIIISHESFSRKVFALGAIQAIKFMNGKTGFYEMRDVLSLTKVIEDLYVHKENKDFSNIKDIVAIDKIDIY